jgi:hypothetical protein
LGGAGGFVYTVSGIDSLGTLSVLKTTSSAKNLVERATAYHKVPHASMR